MSEEPLTSRRESELLEELEVRKRRGEKLTVEGFCRSLGYANKSALRHFPVLKRELSLYIAASGNPGKSQPSAVAYFEAQIKHLKSECNSQKEQLKQIPILEEKLESERLKRKKVESDSRWLRGLLSTVVALIAGSDLAKARDINSQIEALILKEEEALDPPAEQDDDVVASVTDDEKEEQFV